jgi:hypothetical protein
MGIEHWGVSEFLFLLFLLVALVGFVFWLRALLDCATKESNEGNTKVAWIIIICFTNVVGAMAYWLVRRPQRYAELGR